MTEKQPAPDTERRPTSAFEERLRGWMAASERRFEANSLANGDVLELSMLDIVGEDWWTGGGITSKGVQDKLAANPKAKTIKILLNSPGGDAFEGLAIQSLLRRHGARVEVEVVGLAASAASIIAMAGDEIAMHEGALMMVHAPWTFAVGDAEEMRTTAEFLDKVNASGLDVYTRRTGRSRSEVADIVAAETWMTAHEAVKEKFATSVVEAAAPAPAKAKAHAAAQAFMSARKPERPARPAHQQIPPALPAPEPSHRPQAGQKDSNMKTITMAVLAAVLGFSAEAHESLEEKDILDSIDKLKKKADSKGTVTVGGVELLGVSSEAEAGAKVNDLQRLSMAVMGTTNSSSNTEALARIMNWKAGSEQTADLLTQVSDLKQKAESARLDGTIEKLTREGRLAPAQHEWARANFKTAESLETFALTLPSLANLGPREPSDPSSAIVLSAEEKKLCVTLGITEDMFLEERKLEKQRASARVGG